MTLKGKALDVKRRKRGIGGVLKLSENILKSSAVIASEGEHTKSKVKVEKQN